MANKQVSTIRLAVRGRFSFLLISLLLFLIVYPFLVTQALSAIIGIFLTAIMVAGIYSVVNDRRFLLIALALAAPALITRWLPYSDAGSWLVIADFISDILFFGFNTYTILSHILRKRVVTVDMIYGAACVYLLLGLVWGLIFGLLEFVHPGAFSIPGAATMELRDFVATMIYYSFVTLTTLGYGDIVPVTMPARWLSFLEAALGQLYIAVLIARLVGMHISWSARE